jgi:FkbM family methyltransferase
MIRFLKGKKKLQAVNVPLSLKINASSHLEPLVRLHNAVVIDHNPELIEVQIQDFSFMLTTEEDAFILKEIFNDLCYGLSMPASGNYILMDIGMNIGLAAAYFSTLPQVEKIYGFEPFEPTFKQLMNNLERNSLLEKCVPRNMALGEKADHASWSYSPTFKGSSGIVALSGFKKDHSPETELLPVEIADVSKELEAIMNMHPDRKMIIKMDCEGGEYKIIERLSETGHLDKVNIFIIEWHDAVQPDLLKYFSGFLCFYHKISDLTGIIYAIHV